MKNFILLILILTFVSEVIYLYINSIGKPEPEVLALKVSQTPSSTPSALPTPLLLPSAKPTPKPTKVPAPTPVPQPQFTSEQINGFIDRFAGQYGVDPNVIRHLAICESGFNPLAIKLSYYGLFQFGTSAWRNFRIKMGEDPDLNLRLNAEEAVQTAAYALKAGSGKIWPNCMP